MMMSGSGLQREVAFASSQFIVTGLLPYEIEDLKKVFQEFDQDGNGSIDMDELELVLRSQGQNPTREELLEMIREVDEDSNEQIEFEEFIQIIAKNRKDVDLEKEIVDEFTDKENGVDRQETGFCSLNDLRAMLKGLGENITDKEVDIMVKEAFVDRDGQVNYRQFIHGMMGKR
ncbi:hypothetical protein GUITHDRAFT_108572 [Guillardia theta CCMP2712]|uniref:EF-hand domain-containing protein n=1 Tax=Guillardia theta (strain CCMP2712) TaxID=905079 RepID=L1JAY3_GUITC|nr:hypothetical protein GUITHDRAFT_108572 [Guillardia theta CCMP2712]EKX45698.1 hypothetical protein GUITHDRAFT_108572 [Guillardia theta CCMP2712]|eukprot:XP_005832678.1 hypothetical protein GUITHDRAFT_108572 [Guillardia theta CCMP2712]